MRNTLDGLGRAVAVAEHDGTEWVSTNYEYNLADQLVEVTDPAGSSITYSYDKAGRRVGQVDPDRGSATFVYDNAGQQTSVTDGNGNTISTEYDPLGRARARWVGAPNTGTRTASWTYDTPGQIGLLDYESRYTAEGEWRSDVLGYDVKNRPTGTKLTVPAGIPGISRAEGYEVTQTYERFDQVKTTTLPAVGGLAAETLTMGYTSLAMPAAMRGLEDYVQGTGYDDRGRLAASYRGPDQPGTDHTLYKLYRYDSDQRMYWPAVWQRTTQSGWYHDYVGSERMYYDDAGRLVERDVFVEDTAAPAWTECHGYDDRQRLTESHTVEGSTTCAAGTPGTGAQPYDHTYGYTVDSRIDARSEDGGTTSTDYTYDTDQPHAPDAIGGDTYQWDDAGNLTSRTVDGVTETFTWDPEQRLASVQRGGETTSFVYDAGGQRLLRRTADATTLYWAGHEITANADGTQVTAVRSYSMYGEMIATRTPAGVEYLVTTVDGSVNAALTAPGQPASGRRTYEPYGEVREETGSFQTDRGFIGQVEDESTSLSYLNARYYDTTTGIFISPDPLYDTSAPRSLNPYTYSMGNPTTMSDPSGLSPLDTFTLEKENNFLRKANEDLVNEVNRLVGVIGGLQDIIKKQQNQMNVLIWHMAVMEGIIRQQQDYIHKLESEVKRLVGIVNAQQRTINKLRAENAALRRENARLRAENAQLRLENYLLRIDRNHWKNVAGLQGVYIDSLEEKLRDIDAALVFGSSDGFHEPMRGDLWDESVPRHERIAEIMGGNEWQRQEILLLNDQLSDAQFLLDAVSEDELAHVCGLWSRGSAIASAADILPGVSDRYTDAADAFLLPGNAYCSFR